jgi:type II secretory pathway predicted ATPase ExeA
MYETHFDLRYRPFRTTPDTSHYYPATSHERTLNRILQGLNDQEGVILLTADAGIGKTLLGHVILERLGDNVVSAFLTNGHLRDRLALLQAILYELGLPYEGRREQEARLALTELLLKTYSAKRRTILLVDEAHHLLSDLLEELRMLGNLEAGGGKALQVLLIAQPDIADVLELPQLVALRQRLAIRARLDTLTIEESADFLRHQLRLAGGRPERLIADEAVVLLAQSTHGVPRLLNQAAHQAFHLAHEAGASQVDVEAALEALATLGLVAEEEPVSIESTIDTNLAGVMAEDSGPVLSLTDTMTDPVQSLSGQMASSLFDADPGDVDNSERKVLPKRPA